MNILIGCLLLCIGLIGGVTLIKLTTPAVAPPAALIGAAEVSDLIERLKPLAKDPNGAWYSSGITLTFYGSGVSLNLKMPNGNEYTGRASTLKEAVSRLTEPSLAIQGALKGWNKPDDYFPSQGRAGEAGSSSGKIKP